MSDMNEPVNHVSMSSTTQDFDIVSDMKSYSINDSGTTSTSTRAFVLFPHLPAEIRLQIIRAAIGDRVIHISEKKAVVTQSTYGQSGPTHIRRDAAVSGDEREGTTNTLIGERTLSNHGCICDLTDEALHAWFVEPVAFKNRIDWHMRPREDHWRLKGPHRRCIKWNYTDTTSIIDLSLFAVSREMKREALRMFYSTNRFSFSSAITLGKWLGISASPATPWSQSLSPSSDLKNCIRKLRLESGPFAPSTFSVSEIGFDFRHLAKALENISTQLPNLTSLHLSITIDGYVTCFRKSYGTAFVALFRPLRQLKKLKKFTLVILEDHVCWQLAIHDVETHEKGSRDTFFERKEIRQTWAEEITNLVMGEKD